MKPGLVIWSFKVTTSDDFIVNKRYTVLTDPFWISPSCMGFYTLGPNGIQLIQKHVTNKLAFLQYICDRFVEVR